MFRLQTCHQCPYRYCAACRTLDAKAVVTSSLFQDVVAQALRQLFGYVGGAVQIDLLHLADSVGIFKVDHRYTTAIAVFESIQRNSAARPFMSTPTPSVLQGLGEALVGLYLAYAVPIRQKQT